MQRRLPERRPNKKKKARRGRGCGVWRETETGAPVTRKVSRKPKKPLARNQAWKETKEPWKERIKTVHELLRVKQVNT